jgi:hypothetical protein
MEVRGGGQGGWRYKEVGKEDGGKRRRSGQGGWRCKEAGEEDGGTRRRARRMEV